MKTSLTDGTFAMALKQCSIIGWPATSKRGYGWIAKVSMEKVTRHPAVGQLCRWEATHLGHIEGQRAEASATGWTANLEELTDWWRGEVAVELYQNDSFVGRAALGRFTTLRDLEAHVVRWRECANLEPAMERASQWVLGNDETLQKGRI